MFCLPLLPVGFVPVAGEKVWDASEATKRRKGPPRNTRTRAPQHARDSLWQIHNRRPALLGRRPESPEDFLELVVVACPWEERSAGIHLTEDTADTPKVHGRGVLSRAHEDVRCAVPQRHDLDRTGGAVRLGVAPGEEGEAAEWRITSCV